jgi:WD40 repeat protein
MKLKHLCIVFLSLLPLPAASESQAADKLPGDTKPLLQLQAGGPTAAVTSLAFGQSDAGLVLYAAGNDKVVRTWVLKKGAFQPDKIYRVPLGPGVQGAINALAVSGDGRQLAAAGRGVVRGEAGFFESGIVIPRTGWMDEDMVLDEGLIFVFDTTADKTRVLRGHRGPVLALAFVPGRKDKHSLLVSLAREPDRARTGHVGVVRLWDAETGKGLAFSPPLADPQDGRPGLAAWHTGPDLKEVRVAVACDRQRLRVWDPAADALSRVGQAAAFNDTATYRPSEEDPDKGILFTAAAGRRANLVAWNVTAADLQAAPGSTVPLPKLSATAALALLASRLGGRPDHAALVQYFFDGAAEEPGFYLLVVTLGGGTEKALVRLWSGPFPRPALAAAPDSSFVAAAGGQDPVIQVFRTDTLLAKNPRAVVLRSDGMSVARIGFLKGKDKANGLALGEEGQLVFDLAKRRLGERGEDWKADEPDLHGWKVTPPEERAIAVFRGDERVGRVWLEKDQTLSAPAVLLPPGRLAVPLLAVAYVQKGAPYLGLWNAVSGQQVRMLTGHLGPVRAMAFDGAGRRLASVADDQTVNVWSLDDLDEVLGRHGTVLGLAVGVDKDKKALRIAQRDDELLSTANRDALRGVKQDDVVEGLVSDGKLQPLATPIAFYKALWKLKPAAPWEKPGRKAQQAVLRIAGRDVTLDVDQGADERKPLFSLFITRKTRTEDRQWIGWNPEGFYDTGNVARGEKYIGWHFNTGDSDAPTRLAPAVGYHKEFYRDRILEYLYKRGNLPEAIKDWKEEETREPRTEVYIDGVDPDAPRDRAGRLLVRTTALKLFVEVGAIHPARVQSVEWQVLRLGDKGPESISGPPQAFAGTFGALEADLSKLKWQRGPHEVRVLVTLTQEPPRTCTRSRPLHYLPPRPVVEFPTKWLRDTFHDDTLRQRYDLQEQHFHVEANARPGGSGKDGPPLRLRLRHNGKEVTQVKGRTLRAELLLDERRNDVEVEAVNDDIPEKSELARYETSTLPLILYYSPSRRPPLISLRAVEDGGEELSVAEGRPTVVSARKVRIRGTINAADKEDVTSATVQVGTAEPRTLEGFKPGRAIRINEEVFLKQAGKVRVTFRANTDAKRAEDQVAELDYHPPLPRFRVESPRVLEADAPSAVDVVGHLDGPGDLYDFEVKEVRVNGKRAPHSLNGSSRRLTARAAIGPGPNSIEVVLANDCSSHTDVDEVYRKRPPREVTLEPVGKPIGLSVDFRATVKVHPARPLTRALFARTRAGGRWLQPREIDWRPVDPDEWKQEIKDGVAVWTALLKAAPLAEKANAYELRVANEDGQAASGPIAVVGTAPAPDPPQVVVELPPGPVAVPRCDLTIRVRSPGGVPSLQLWRNGQPVKDRALDEPKKEDGEFVFRIVELTLDEGANELKAVATAAGVPSKLVRENMSYVPPTAKVYLDGFVDPDGKRFARDEKAPVGRVDLRGRVEWPTDDDPALTLPLRVRVWVNDFEQTDAEMQPPVGRVRRFEAPVVLNRKENRIELKFSEAVKLAERQHLPSWTVLCGKPEPAQRLHLLIVAPEVETAEALDALTNRVLDTLGATQRKDNHFRTRAFAERSTWYAIGGWEKPERVESSLFSIKISIKKSSPGKFSDVVLVYFQGKTLVKGGKTYLHWSDPNPDPAVPVTDYAIDPDAVRGQLSDVLGAKLLLLDVAAKDSTLGGEAFPRVGDLQYIWLGADSDPKRRFLLQDLKPSLAPDGRWRTVRQRVHKAAGDREKEVAVRTPSSPPGYDDIPLKE